jgi:iturin family lipopeptide synthetase A
VLTSAHRDDPTGARPCLLCLAATGEAELRQLAETAASQLLESSVVDTFRAGDDVQQERARLAITGTTVDEIASGLASFISEQPSRLIKTHIRTDDPMIAFIFAGQSETRAGMGYELYRDSQHFARIVDRCSMAIGDMRGGATLVSALYGSTDPGLLDDARLAQPALFALQGGLAALWSQWGVRPDAVAGHSLGEYAAACAAGLISLDDGIDLVAKRGCLTQSLASRGAMAVLFASVEWARAAVAGKETDLAIAAINAPEVVVVSGRSESISRLLEFAEGQEVSGKRLNISHAFHSPCVDSMLADLESAAARIPLSEPRVRFASTLEGRLLDPGEIPDATYWRRHAREPVQFLSTVRELASAGCNLFVELGPHATLTSLGERCVPRETAQWLSSLMRSGDDWRVMADTAITLWLAGAQLDLAALARSLAWDYIGPARGVLGASATVTIEP